MTSVASVTSPSLRRPRGDGAARARSLSAVQVVLVVEDRPFHVVRSIFPRAQGRLDGEPQHPDGDRALEDEEGPLENGELREVEVVVRGQREEGEEAVHFVTRLGSRSSAKAGMRPGRSRPGWPRSGGP